MQIPDYIILTPIAPFKLYSLDRFVENIMFFRQKPKEIVFCAEPEITPEISKWTKKLKNKGIKLVILKLKPYLIKKFPGYNIEKLTFSREKLRKYFINSKFEWALWLDSDLIPEKNVAKVLSNIAQSEKYLMVTNKCRSRMTEGLILGGIGCTLAHKAACQLTKFRVPSCLWKGRLVKFPADDFWFLTTIQAGDQFIKNKIGWNVRKIGRFVSIWHLTGSDKFPNKFLKKETN